VDQNPRDRTLVEKLKDLIASQVPLLEIAISVHRSKAPPNLMPFQERLEKCFNEMQISVETKYGKRVSFGTKELWETEVVDFFSSCRPVT
jgi:dedicator of cytokinesis protein 1